MQLSDEEIQNLTLLDIEKLMQANNKSLKEFPTIPYPKGYVASQLGNRLIYEERNYDIDQLQDVFQNCYESLTGYILNMI